MVNCQTKLRINHLTAVKSDAILEKPDEIDNLIEEVDLFRHINSEVNCDDGQALLDFYNQELRQLMKSLRCMRRDQDIEELESVDRVQSEDRMTVGYLTGLI
ncbi:hypothetical protein TNCV_3726131 [Trichonephila clavipes]|nr:hypothetical protein TNCV_3726131 [Trichonephila clavipes]